jgi:hypothetical protein
MLATLIISKWTLLLINVQNHLAKTWSLMRIRIFMAKNTRNVKPVEQGTMQILGSDVDAEDEESDDVDTECEMIGGKTFGEWMTEHVKLLQDFADGLEY